VGLGGLSGGDADRKHESEEAMSIGFLKNRIDLWAAEVSDQNTDVDRKRELKDWAFGVSVALRSLGGYDEIEQAAADIWNPPIPEDDNERN